MNFFPVVKSHLFCLWIVLSFFHVSNCWGIESERSFSLSQLCRETEGCAITESTIKDCQTRYASWNNQEVTIRGFLYQTDEGRWVIASIPNLKTCCIGRTSKALTQVFAKGDLSSPSPEMVTTLKGTFSIRPIYDSENTLSSLFHLDNAEVVKDPMMISKVLWVVLLGFGIGLAVFYKSRS